MLDPYKVLNIDPKNLTFELLKSKYRKLVLKYHPDVGGSESVFKTITFCYKYLLNELKTREEQKEHHTLKQQSKESKSEFSSKTSTLFPQGSDFDIAKFNAAFENFKYKEDYIEDGYDNWIKEDKLEDKGAIINYKDPEPLFSGRATGNLYEIGKSKVNDYSSDNISNRSLNFMDLKVAYTTSKLVDETRLENRQEFKNVDELKKHRANISFSMSKEDLAKHTAQQLAAKKAEEQRLANMKKEESKIEQFYKKTNQMMLSIFGK